MINDKIFDCETIAKKYERDISVVLQRFKMIEDELKAKKETYNYIKVSHLTNKYFREQFYKGKGI